MKSIVVLLLVAVGVNRVSGEGVIAYATFVRDRIDAPVLDVDCRTPVGRAFSAQVYAGLEPGSLSPVGPVMTFNSFGYITPLFTIRFPQVSEIGTIAYTQLRAWNTAAGGSYEEAVSSAGKFGESNLVPMVMAFGTQPPNIPIGIQGFCLVPEPGTYALGAMGGALLVASSYKTRKGARTS